MSSTSIYLLIFFAAFLHALWNIIIKSLDNSLAGIAYKVFFQSIIFTPIIFFVPLPEGITWFYLICSFLLIEIKSSPKKIPSTPFTDRIFLTNSF